MPRQRILSFFQVVMINVIAVDSIRNLPFSAAFGFSLVFLYFVISVCFFFPAALVAAELGSSWPVTGGLYIWVREAFGKKISLLTIWLNWIYNLFWYPTIMALIAGTITYFFNPDLAYNKFYMASVIIGLFWVVTLINCFGMKISSHFSTVTALIGTILPMMIIVLLGVYWIMGARPMQMEVSWKALLPSSFELSNIAYTTNILFGLIGLEMSATHAEEIRNPTRNYARALMVSALIILVSSILSSLAIAIIVPQNSLSLVTGIMQAFANFTDVLNLPWLLPFVAGCIILGGLGGAGAWIIGPTKGLMIAARDGSLPAVMMHENRHGIPVNTLILQAVFVSFISLAFVYMPTVNSSFWLLSVITAQLALLSYIFVFASAIALRHRKPDVRRHFKIPGGTIGIWLISGLGILTSVVVIILGFLPPTHVPIENILVYELILGGGMLLFSILPFLFRNKKTMASQRHGR